jgi:hypothetical protein
MLACPFTDVCWPRLARNAVVSVGSDEACFTGDKVDAAIIGTIVLLTHYLIWRG